MNPRRFLGSEFSQYPAAHARFHVIPVPYEHSVSYGGGTAEGPAAILEASDQLEVFDGSSSPGEDGIHTHPPVDCSGGPAEVFPRITSLVASVLQAGAEHTPVPVILGGEHSITPPAVAACRDVFSPDGEVGLIQIDAHADLRESYQDSRDSHACIARRIHEDLGMPVIQIGVRSLSPEEVIYRAGHTAGAPVPIYYHDAADIVPTGVAEIPIPDSFPSRAYLTIDVDGLDSAIMPATGTPVPGGLGWYQTLAIIESVARSVSIIGFDVVELAPIAGQHAWQYTAAELTYRVMGIISRGGAPSAGRRRVPPERT